MIYLNIFLIFLFAITQSNYSEVEVLGYNVKLFVPKNIEINKEIKICAIIENSTTKEIIKNISVSFFIYSKGEKLVDIVDAVEENSSYVGFFKFKKSGEYEIRVVFGNAIEAIFKINVFEKKDNLFIPIIFIIAVFSIFALLLLYRKYFIRPRKT